MAAKSFANDGTDAMEGRRIGPYKIVREIGHGGMGVVYLAERADHQYEKRVAIKVIRRHLDADSMFRRFRSEQQILANLDHPNIAKLLDGGTTEDRLSYFIMDYIEGLPMDLYCDKNKLPTVERLALFRAACASVQYAHQHDILHCDLKPSNFLITAEGVPKLLDFGIAKLLNPQPSSQKTQSTVTGLRPMTLGYASPEQVRGETITPLSDVYSLGLVLYELLTGHRPYVATSSAPQEMERMICEHQPEKPSAVISRTDTIPGLDGTAQITVTPESVSAVRDGQPEKLRRRLAGDLDNIVLMALRKEPERRYGSVEQFSEDIRRHLNGEPVLARRDTLWYRSAKFLKRNQAAVVAAALTAVILALVAIGLGLLTGRTQVDSIAVLPFASVSPDPNTKYLSEGISETVMNELSQLPNLKVISGASAVGYGGNEQDPRAVGRSLKVQGVLTGKVVQSGNDLTVHAELVDVRTNRHLWEREYTRKLSEIVVLEKDIARQISANFTQLTGEGEERAKGGTENPDAYREYLVGRHFWSQRSPAALEQGLQHFQRAIELDPNYALAYSGLADSYVGFATFRARSAKESYLQARAAAGKALELEPTLAEAHSALAMVNLYYDWDWAAAEREFNRAIALKPGDTTAHLRYGLAMAWFQRFDDARREIARALEVDPVHPLLNQGMGQIFYWERRYDEAMREYRKALVLDPNYFAAYLPMGEAYVQTGAYDEAIAVLKKAIELGGGGAQIKAALADTYALSGQTGEAKKILADLTDRSRQTYAPPFDVALAYVGLGDYDQAFAWLEKAHDERARPMLSLKVNPRLDPLRSDPRFADLQRRVGALQ
jgi:serine/threonine protein kinase/tetratricopeptide (TPR) repeat protein